MARTKRTAATFAWRLLKSDMKLLAYPIIHVVLMIVLLWSMWSMIFDISAMELAGSAEDAAMMHQESSSETDSTAYQREHERESSDINNIFGHIHFGWLFVFLIINALIGEQEDAVTFNEEKPLSEYFSQSLGLPVRSTYLNKSIRELKTLPPAEISKWNEELKVSVQQLTNYAMDRSIDGSRKERHVFSNNGIEFLYVPIELFP